MRRAPVITLFAAAAVFALSASFALPREGGEHDVALSATGGARVAVALDGTGAMREATAGTARLGLRWPGPGGTEFLGSCGFVLRCRLGDRGTPIVLRQQSFEPVFPGTGIVRLWEGCLGGCRGPAPAGDDDGDGAIDEDPFDGIDNDGDGKIDEDFAAVGHDMLVTGARSGRGGLSLTQACYHWDFGHVRDFIGFTTTILYDPPRRQDRPLQLFEAALVTDFRIGDPDDDRRGENDRFRHVAEWDERETTPRYAFSFSRDQGGAAAAVVILSATGPDGDAMPVTASIVAAANAADSLWEPSARMGEMAVLGRDGAAAPFAGGIERLSGLSAATIPVVGERAFVHRFGEGVELRPGGSVTIEWAMVFGRDLPAVMRAASRARATWRGIDDAVHGGCRWVVPARTARRLAAEASLSPAWVLGERCAAAALLLPPGFDEDVEWIAVDGAGVGSWEVVSGRIVTILDGALIDRGSAFPVEAQLTDGTILSGRIDAAEIARFRGIETTAPGRLPEESLRLFPNPFASTLTIDLALEESALMMEPGAVRAGAGSVRIYDIRGRLVRSILDDQPLHPGEHTVSWDGTDEAGAPVSPGVYYCKFQVGERSLTKRVILLR